MVYSGSTYTILDIDLFHSFPESVKSRFVDCSISLRCASGELLKAFGEVPLHLQLNGKIYEMCVTRL